MLIHLGSVGIEGGWCRTPRLVNSSRSETIFFSLYANAIAEGGRNEINYFFTFFTSRAPIYAWPSLLPNWACACVAVCKGTIALL